jgi:hypothetical protein
VTAEERWETVKEIATARERFEAGIPGYAPPAAYGVGLTDLAVDPVAHSLPAVVLATVVGHTAGTRPAVAVFGADPSDPVTGEADRLLRSALPAA